MRKYHFVSVCLACLVVADVAAAQPLSEPTPPVAPSNAPPEVIAPGKGTTNAPGASVIRPPNVDPRMSVEPPANSPESKTVIPPPGTPGGKPNPTPK
jgi:hypothetical protein